MDDHGLRFCPSMEILKKEGKCHINHRGRISIGPADQNGPEVRRGDQPFAMAIETLLAQFPVVTPAAAPAPPAAVKAIRLGSKASESSSDSDTEEEIESVSVAAARRFDPYARPGVDGIERRAEVERRLPSAKNLRPGFYAERGSKDAGTRVHFEEGDVEMSDASDASKSSERASKAKTERAAKLKEAKNKGKEEVKDKAKDKGKSKEADDKTPAKEEAPVRGKRLLDQMADETNLERVLTKIMHQASGLSVGEVLAISPGLRRLVYRKSDMNAREVVESMTENNLTRVRSTRLIPSEEPPTPADEDMYAVACPHATVEVNGTRMPALFDSGSEINVISLKRANQARLPRRENPNMTMLGVNGGVSEFVGVCTAAQVSLGGASRTVPLFVVATDDYSLILGRVWERKARMSTRNTDDACCEITITGDDGVRVTIQAAVADNPSNRTVKHVFGASLNE